MAFESWHDYGFGICVDDLSEAMTRVPVGERMERYTALLDQAPKFKATVLDAAQTYRENQDETFEGLTLEDVEEYEDGSGLDGLCLVLLSVMNEVEEDIEFTVTDDFDGKQYIMLHEKMPWRFSQREKNLTEESLTAIFESYVYLLTDEPIFIGDQKSANGS